MIIFINIRDVKTRQYRVLKAYISENTKRLNNFFSMNDVSKFIFSFNMK